MGPCLIDWATDATWTQHSTAQQHKTAQQHGTAYHLSVQEMGPTGPHKGSSGLQASLSVLDSNIRYDLYGMTQRPLNHCHSKETQRSACSVIKFCDSIPHPVCTTRSFQLALTTRLSLPARPPLRPSSLKVYLHRVLTHDCVHQRVREHTLASATHMLYIMLQSTC